MQDVRKRTVNGRTFVSQFNGVLSNNCFRSMGMPDSAKKYYLCDPGFAGTDTSDKNSYKLTEKSELLGRGIQAEENMGAYDFYGNALTDTHNIGCYDGAGEPVQAEKQTCIILECHKDSIAKANTLFSTVIGHLQKTVLFIQSALR